MWCDVLLCGMAKYESVKLLTSVVNKVRKHKEKSGMPINTFIEKAIEDKLAHEKQVQLLLASMKPQNSSGIK